MISTRNFDQLGWEIFIGTVCPYCSNRITKKNLTIDHVVPKSFGYKYGPVSNNTIVCCNSCNLRKSNKDLLTFLGLVKLNIVPKPIVKSKTQTKMSRANHITITDLLLKWEQKVEDYDNAMDNEDIRLASSIENYLDMLAEEINCFSNQV